MPTQSIWMIRISLGYLLVASLIGSLLLIHKVIEIHPSIWALLPLHFEMAIWGWIVQFVMGTAYWIFPRYLQSMPRGSEKIAWVVVVLLNSGFLFLIADHLFGFDPLLKLSGRILITASIGCFVAIMWKRVVSYRNLEHNH
ncbi:MAG: hypothetical protein R3220_12400 [Balneolaceae bacterium]|nr:hypothetical protein [Balneolaceae bacterium]